MSSVLYFNILQNIFYFFGRQIWKAMLIFFSVVTTATHTAEVIYYFLNTVREKQIWFWDCVAFVKLLLL